MKVHSLFLFSGVLVFGLLGISIRAQESPDEADPPPFSDEFDPSQEDQPTGGAKRGGEPSQPKTLEKPIDEAPLSEPTPAPQTNTGQSFEDPFAEEPVPAGPTFTPAPSFRPTPTPDSSLQPTPQPTPYKPIEFPEPEELKGPVSNDFYETKAIVETKRKGKWNAGGAAGLGYNINRMPTQIHLEVNGGYRLRENIELGGIISYRFIDQWFLGFLVTGRYAYPLIKKQSLHIEWQPLVGTGWTNFSINAKKFTRTRWTWRFNSDFAFYAKPNFALVAVIGLETYVLDYINGDGFSNPGKGGGWPTGGILGAGARFEF